MSLNLSSLFNSLYVKTAITLTLAVWLSYFLFKKFLKRIKTKSIPNKISSKLEFYYFSFVALLSTYSITYFFTGYDFFINYIECLISFILLCCLGFLCTKLTDSSRNFFEYSYYTILVAYSISVSQNFDIAYTEVGNYLTASLSLGAGLLMAVIRFHNNDRSIIIRLLFLMLAILFLKTLLMFMGRSPLIFAGLLILVFAFINIIKNRDIISIFIMACIVVMFFYYNLDTVVTSGFYKRLLLFESEGLGDRVTIYSDALDSLKHLNFLTGHGFSVSGKVVYDDFFIYPHNLHLHFLFELGVIGFIFSLIFPSILIYGFIRLLKGENDDFLVFYFSYFYFYLNFMKSFSMYDSWLLFVFGGIFLGQLRRV